MTWFVAAPFISSAAVLAACHLRIGVVGLVGVALGASGIAVLGSVLA